MLLADLKTPRKEGYYFPAEWARHTATWLSYPHNENSFPNKINTIYPSYFEFVKQVAQSEIVNINVKDERMRLLVKKQLQEYAVPTENIKIHIFPNNDAWCRDHGPAFVINPEHPEHKKAVVKWDYNAWGDKYPPYDLDNQIPYHIAEYLQLPLYEAGIVMEGGSVDFNGEGTLITSTACLLNPNRNPALSRQDIETYLCEYYGVAQILWVADGIVGDDTDGHIDDITRFINEDTVVTVIEKNKNDENYLPLQENLQLLSKMRLLNDKQLNIIELPMPSPVIWEEQRLPASYANFYICNAGVIVPTFQCPEDQIAIDTLEKCFPEKKVIPIDSVEIIWGLGSFHCLSQQEPAV
ncbi:MAG: agmatine deiminase family protein [Cytophagales bacterium]|nr:MAG: agmatine deiminase family protein [Cytophagales bacterium]